jgi:tRNA pseudouridine55 synthase
MRHGVSGVIPIDKPVGASSRRVVDAVAKAVGMKTVGHAGTLDPLASGVVVVCVGHATRLVDFVHALPKAYSATFLLGRSSPSDDLETAVEIEENPIVPTLAQIEAAAGCQRGEILQRPCDYSAVHVDGKRAYRLARKGREFSLEPKRVRIDRLDITGYDWPRLAVEVVCSSGTFIRAIGRDLAAALGTTSVMESLVRTSVGPFSRAAAMPLAEVASTGLGGRLLPAAAAVPHLPRITLGGDVLAAAIRGGLIGYDGTGASAIAAFRDTGELVGILQPHESGRFRLKPNFLGD